MAEDVSVSLGRRAAEVSSVISAALRERRIKPSEGCYPLATDIAVRLHLINEYLGSLPPYWIEPDVEELCRILWQDLQDVITSRSSGFFSWVPFGKSGPLSLETILLDFLRYEVAKAQILRSLCDELVKKLTRDEDGEVQNITEGASSEINAADMSAYFNGGIFDALQSLSECNPKVHKTLPGTDQNSLELWHRTRLCLSEVNTDIRVLVPNRNMELWQEFCLRTQPQSPIEEHLHVLERSGFCLLVERDISARLVMSFKAGCGFTLLKDPQQLEQILQPGLGQPLANVLRNYELTPKDRVLLAYAVAQAYWQYYDSDLMRIGWTSEIIWFMPDEDQDVEELREADGDRLPLCAYLTFPFDTPKNSPTDILLEDFLVHRFPRIFDIGVLLLEIGLGKPFRRGKKQDMVAQANINHKMATDEHRKLENMDWDGFLNKRAFDQAVGFCLKSANFITDSEKPKPIGSGVAKAAKQATTSDPKKGILARRKIFYKNVVKPLAWLAQEGFKAQAGKISYIIKKPEGSQPELPKTVEQPEPQDVFHSVITPQNWVGDLKKISTLVAAKRRQYRVTTPIRVAILDTGLNKDFAIFQDKPALLKCVTDEIDYVNPGAQMTDNYGHGTLMARLVMECAPGAEILVARVANDMATLTASKDNIREAILWAGQKVRANIISMSWGVSAIDDEGIKDAIMEVRNQRKEDIIFLASAGNSDTDDESFPARLPGVIGVYGTDCHGVRLPSNAAMPRNAAWVLGTYGADLPDRFSDEFRDTYPNICQPGTSIATAVMAAISATLLAYATVLPSLAGPAHYVLRRLWTSDGMEAVLCRMAPDEDSRLRAVKPPVFWKNRSDDTLRYCAIHDALSDVERWSPRRQPKALTPAKAKPVG